MDQCPERSRVKEASQLRSRRRERQERGYCLRGHVLIQTMAQGSCDICLVRQEGESAEFWNCRRCNFDLCKACLQRPDKEENYFVVVAGRASQLDLSCRESGLEICGPKLRLGARATDQEKETSSLFRLPEQDEPLKVKVDMTRDFSRERLEPEDRKRWDCLTGVDQLLFFLIGPIANLACQIHSSQLSPSLRPKLDIKEAIRKGLEAKRGSSLSLNRRLKQLLSAVLRSQDLAGGKLCEGFEARGEEGAIASLLEEDLCLEEEAGEDRELRVLRGPKRATEEFCGGCSEEILGWFASLGEQEPSRPASWMTKLEGLSHLRRRISALLPDGLFRGMVVYLLNSEDRRRELFVEALFQTQQLILSAANQEAKGLRSSGKDTRLKDVETILHGSAANGLLTPRSDLDVIVRTNLRGDRKGRESLSIVTLTFEGPTRQGWRLDQDPCMPGLEVESLQDGYDPVEVGPERRLGYKLFERDQGSRQCRRLGACDNHRNRAGRSWRRALASSMEIYNSTPRCLFCRAGQCRGLRSVLRRKELLLLFKGGFFCLAGERTDDLIEDLGREGLEMKILKEEEWRREGFLTKLHVFDVWKGIKHQRVECYLCLQDRGDSSVLYALARKAGVRSPRFLIAKE